MNVTRTTLSTVMVSHGEIVQALKLLHPKSLDIASLPDHGNGVTITAGGQNVTIKYSREAAVHG